MNNNNIKEIQFGFILKNHFAQILKAFYKNVWIDIKSLPKWIWPILAISCLISAFFSFFSFQNLAFEFPNFIFVNIDHSSQTQRIVMKILFVIQIFFTTVSIFNVVLIVYGKQSGWFWGAVGYLFFGLSAIPFGFGSVAMSSLFFVIWIQIFGSFWWSAKQIKYPEHNVIMTKLKWYHCVIYLITLALLFILFYEIVPYFEYYVCGDKYPYIIDKKIGQTGWKHAWPIQVPRFLDAFCGAGNIVDVVATVFCFKINWILWGILDCFQIALFVELNGNGIDYNYFILYIIYILYSVYGVYIWYFKNDYHYRDILF